MEIRYSEEVKQYKFFIFKVEINFQFNGELRKI